VKLEYALDRQMNCGNAEPIIPRPRLVNLNPEALGSYKIGNSGVPA
jgi:hypothetical protein